MGVKQQPTREDVKQEEPTKVDDATFTTIDTTADVVPKEATYSHIAQVELVNELTFNEKKPEALSAISDQEYMHVLKRARKMKKKGVCAVNQQKFWDGCSCRRIIYWVIPAMLFTLWIVLGSCGLTMIAFGIRALVKSAKYSRQSALLGLGIATTVTTTVFLWILIVLSLTLLRFCTNSSEGNAPVYVDEYQNYLKEVRLYYAARGVLIKGVYWPGTNKSALLFEHYAQGVPSTEFIML